MSRALTVASATLCLRPGVSSYLSQGELAGVFGGDQTFVTFNNLGDPTSAIRQPETSECWNAASRVMIAADSEHVGQASGCATIDSDICIYNQSSYVYDCSDHLFTPVAIPHRRVVFDRGYANYYRYADLTSCEEASTHPSGSGPCMVAQSLAVEANADRSDAVGDAVLCALQDAARFALYEQGHFVETDVMSISDLFDEFSVSALETNEYSPFGNDAVREANGGRGLSAKLAGGPGGRLSAGVAVGVFVGIGFWRVDYSVVISEIRSARSFVGYMQDVEFLREGVFYDPAPLMGHAVSLNLKSVSRPRLQPVTSTTTATTATTTAATTTAGRLREGEGEAVAEAGVQVEGQQTQEEEQSPILVVAAATTAAILLACAVAAAVMTSRRRLVKSADASDAAEDDGVDLSSAARNRS